MLYKTYEVTRDIIYIYCIPSIIFTDAPASIVLEDAARNVASTVAFLMREKVRISCKQ